MRLIKQLRALDVTEERELAGRFAGALYLLAGISVLLMLLTGGVPTDRWPVPAVIAAAAIAWGICALWVVNWRATPAWLSHLSSAGGVPLTMAVVAFTGGAESPAVLFLLFPIVYSAFFYPASEALAYLVACALGAAAPLLYDDTPWLMAELVVLIPVMLVLGTMLIHGRRLMLSVRALSQHQARHDSLTGLANRRALVAEVRARLGKRERMGLLLLDLDSFKDANSLYGYPGGDRVLMCVSSLLCRVAGPDDLVARLGGDEFAIVTSRDSNGDMRRMAADVAGHMAAVSEELDMPGFVLAGSMGWALHPDHARSFDDLLGSADLALRQRKSAGHGVPVDAPRPAAARATLFAGAPEHVPEVLERLPQQACDVLGADQGWVAVPDESDSDYLIPIAAHGAVVEDAPTRFPADKGVAGAVIRTGRPQYRNRYQQAADRMAHPLTEELTAVVAVPISWHGAVRAAIGVATTDPNRRFGARDIHLLKEIAEVGALALENAAVTDRLAQTVRGGVRAIASAVEMRDSYTAAHSESVVELSLEVGRRMRFDPASMADLEYGARLHDVGKIGVPDAILRKQGPLDAAEWAVMRRHPEWGEAILRGVPGLESVARIVRAEHERWDGEGYPDGLAGGEIPLASRIVFACDAWHAMTSDRPYRAALPDAEALHELERGAGSQFDPTVVEVLTAVIAEGAAAAAQLE